MLESQFDNNHTNANKLMAGVEFRIKNTDSLNVEEKKIFKLVGACLRSCPESEYNFLIERNWRKEAVLVKIDFIKAEIEVYTVIMYEIIERKLSFKEIEFLTL